MTIDCDLSQMVPPPDCGLVVPVEGLWAVQEVAAHIGCSVNSVYRYLRLAGFPQPLRVGPRFVRWAPDQVREWIASQ